MNLQSIDADIEHFSAHDIAPIGSNVLIDNKCYVQDEFLMIIHENKMFLVVKYIFAKDNIFLSGIDFLAKTLIPLSKAQVEQYILLRGVHAKRFGHKQVPEFEFLENVNDSLPGLTKIGKNALSWIGNERTVLCKEIRLSINNNEYDINTFSILVSANGDSLVTSVAEKLFCAGLNKEGLYNEVNFYWKVNQKKFVYRGNIVRIKKDEDIYTCYIQPYPMEILQSKKMIGTKFENISNPFSVMDFIVNHSDSDVKGITYPHSENRSIQNYIVVGVLENIKIEIEECVLGNVRIGGNIESSNEFRELLTVYKDKEYTLIWVSLKTDSLYNAFRMGKQLLQSEAAILSLMTKNDVFDDWYGTAFNEKGYWDIRNHSPKARMANIYYVENCIMGECVTLNEESWTEPHFLKIQTESEYLLEYDWIEKFFISLEKENPVVMRLQYAIKWINEAWNAGDKYDRVIYCSMALEFIVNGEKGKNIFAEYAEKSERKNITKLEKKILVNRIVDSAKLDEIDGMTPEIVEDLNKSIQNMLRNKLGESSFGTKLDCLIERLKIPVNNEEKELLSNARRIRNQLIHGIEMKSLSTLEAKKLCGVTSRILICKLQDELQEK